ncbi:MAG: tetratricopeptide repeat protein, partial [Candidatus Erginobacter occultus]|nr:tetratricopeptide repeat protein [Candidatus Erginobacter occultus]
MTPAFPTRSGLAAVLAAAAILFVPSLRFPFIWDDTAVVRDNPFIHSRVPPGLFFRPAFWQQLLPVSRFDYRPLQMLTLAAVSRIGGTDPLYYRSANLALHLLVVLLVFGLAGRLGAGKWAALLAAAYFAFHPVHVESIICARNISELASAALLLSALGIFLRPGRCSPVIALPFFAAALLYKESALIFPPLLTILVAAAPGEPGPGKSRLRGTVPFWILAAAGGLGKILLSSGPRTAVPPPVGHLLAGAARLLVTNLRLLVFPARLKLLYPFPRPETWPESVWFFSLAGAVLLAAALLASRKNRLLFSLLLCLPISLLPALSRVGTAGRIVAEQRLYLPSFFFCLGAAILIDRARNAAGGRRRAAIGFVAWLICLPLAGLTTGYLRDWRDELPLWSRVTSLSPRAGVAFNNLAIALSRAGDTEGARRGWERALEIDPRLPEAHTNLGILRGREGRWEEAADRFREALSADPAHHPAAIYLAQTYRRWNRNEEAADLLRAVRKQNPGHAVAANELAIVLERLGKEEEAIELYRAAADLNPKYAAPLRNLAALLGERGEFERA